MPLVVFTAEKEVYDLPDNPAFRRAFSSRWMGAHVAFSEALTAAGAPATIGGLLGIGSMIGAKRREVLRKHPIAYLYGARQQG